MKGVSKTVLNRFFLWSLFFVLVLYALLLVLSYVSTPALSSCAVGCFELGYSYYRGVLESDCVCGDDSGFTGRLVFLRWFANQSQYVFVST